MKNLYKVEIAATVLILADSEEQACQDALSHIDSTDGGIEFVTDNPRLVLTISDIPREWRGALPYGEQQGDKELTVDEIVQQLEATQ